MFFDKIFLSLPPEKNTTRLTVPTKPHKYRKGLKIYNYEY